ncbi:MAG: YidC/Oxa1 family membrane protein insertase [Gracilibacteraceae bacterium]|jgi:YidC/Oxa1 family membrane protein insertase|nr:YidC/Oxa1 family membrane protein insertase [Gracilibacteraceae bacterium]
MIQAITDGMASFLEILFGLASAVGLHSYGWAVIMFTIIIRMLIYPLTWKQTKSMRRMAEVQPKMQELQKKFAHDKQKLNQKIMELYSKENVNPYAGCLPVIVQLPVIMIFYNMLRTFPFGDGPSSIFFGYHLTEIYGWRDFAHWPLAILVGLSAYFSTKISMSMNKPPVPTDKGKKAPPTPQQAQAENMQKIMLRVMPFFLLYITFTLPSGLGWYFFTTNAVSALQSYYIGSKLQKEAARKQAADEEKAERERQERQERQEQQEKGRKERRGAAEKS